MADCEELRTMISSFRVSELQVLLGFAGRNKSGRKHDLLVRALHLIKNGCSPAVQIKIKDLYRRRFPRTLEGVPGLSSIRSSVFNLDSSSSVESDLAGAGVHSLSSSSVGPHSPASPLGSVLLQDTKPPFEIQQLSPPIPPVHPDVHLRSLPFYDVLDVLIKPTSLVQNSIQRFQEKFFIFALTPQQVREICISRLCLAETSCPQEDNYPSNLCIKVNGKLFPLPGSTPPPKNGIEQKRPGRPLNITSLARLSSAVPNQVSISWASEIGKNYSMSVYLVRQLTSAVLLQKLKMKGIRNPDHSRALIKEKLTADPDSEIATTSLRVSLMCPVSKALYILEILRSLAGKNETDHSLPSCDLHTLAMLRCGSLSANEREETLMDLSCVRQKGYLRQSNIRWEALCFHRLFMEILNQGSDIEEIQFQENGSWCPMRPKKETLATSSTQYPNIKGPGVISKMCSVMEASETTTRIKAEVIDLTIESSSDEEAEPPAKKSCVYQPEAHGSPMKGVLTYQPSTIGVAQVTEMEPDSILPSVEEYSDHFHHTSIASMSAGLPGLDFLSLIPVDSQSQLGITRKQNTWQAKNLEQPP
ncbi:E3 SUMO-protein ligase PIAS2 isoform X2 [Ascaphus truei]|uniref:E3 SUMO-protein ligase PIAS2 isoform X2 n=1 Tax=Ascaphus truei TaxID=8439 RepID=UPI003F59FDAA